MQKLLIILVFLLGIMAGCVGEASDDDDDDARSEMTSTGDPAAGEIVFDATCGNTSCHGSNGVSGPGADLPDLLDALSDSQIKAIVRAGVGQMPAQTQLSDDDLDNVLAFLRRDIQ